MAPTYVLFFSQCSLADAHVIGGKGANLGELTQAGFPVPPGFALRASAYDDFLRANGLDSEIPRRIAEVSFADHQQVAEVTASIRQRIAQAFLPKSIADEVLEAYATLGNNALVAVRSSSAVPSLDIGSFPGQMDTFYDVSGPDALLQHVQLCWASLWNARAAANRWNKGVDHFAVKVSGLVQRMVPAEFSGVAFTANPVTQEPQIIVEAIAGLGEALVSGRTTPERFVFIRDRAAVEKPAKGSVPFELVSEVAQLALRIENHYGKPQDIEWAHADGKLWVLQSRSIGAGALGKADYTGLERWNKPPRPGDNEILWTRAWSDEVLTRALTPLFYSVQADLITTTYDFIQSCYGLKDLLPLRIMRFHKNRAYFSTHYLMQCMRYVPGFARGDDALKFFTPQQKEQARRLPFRAVRKLGAELRLAVRYRRYSFTRCWRTFYGEWLPELLRRVEELDSRDLGSAPPQQLEAYFWGMDRLMKEHCRPIGVGVMVHTFAAVTFLGKALEAWCGRADAAATLLSGLPGNRTAEMNNETWQLAAAIRRDPRLESIFRTTPTSRIAATLEDSEHGKACLERIREFSRKYGFRGAADREISFPRWGDDLNLLLDVLRLLVPSGEGSDPALLHHRNIEKRERLTRELVDQLSRQRWGWFKQRVFNFLLKYAQIYSLFRENQRFEIDRVFYGQRKAFVAIANFLVRSGALSALDDIWFLGKEEVFDLLSGRLTGAEVQRKIVPRRAEYRRYLRNAPAMFLEGDREFDAAVESTNVECADSLLAGVAASPGTATGVARVLTDLDELTRIQPGDILVTNSTDPGWTPAFLLIRGLVLETGGILAHGTVLSREYGIPAVTSVHEATRRIRDGDVIAIDGTRGTVALPKPSTVTHQANAR